MRYRSSLDYPPLPANGEEDVPLMVAVNDANQPMSLNGVQELVRGLMVKTATRLRARGTASGLVATEMNRAATLSRRLDRQPPDNHRQRPLDRKRCPTAKHTLAPPSATSLSHALSLSTFVSAAATPAHAQKSRLERHKRVAVNPAVRQSAASRSISAQAAARSTNDKTTLVGADRAQQLAKLRRISHPCRVARPPSGHL